MEAVVERDTCASFQIKSFDLETREFSGMASTWDVDLGRERFEKGAFAQTIKHWRSSQNSETPRIIPILDSHDHGRVRSVFGKVVDMEETPQGLKITARVVPTPDGDEYLARIQGGYLNGLSVGFNTLKEKMETRKAGGKQEKVRVITEARLMEISAVNWGENPFALIGAKSLVKEEKGRKSMARFRDELDDLLGDEEPETKAEAEEAVAEPEAPEQPAPKPEPEEVQEPEAPAEEKAEPGEDNVEEPEPTPMEAAVATMEKEVEDLREQKAAAVANEDYFDAEDLKIKIEALQSKIRREKKLIAEVKRIPVEEWSLASRARRKREAELELMLAEAGDLVKTA